MKNIYKAYLLSFFLLSDFIVFAGPGDDTAGGDLEDDETPITPINSKLILLLILGVVFAFYQIKRHKKVS